METSLQPISQLQLGNTSGSLFLVDEICKLPDDVLVTILSFLTMKEAARSSILSHRWKNLWKLITSRLDFDNWNVLQGINGSLLVSLRRLVRRLESGNPFDQLKSWEFSNSKELVLLRQGTSKYIKWVNQILDSHKGTRLEILKVHFDLDLALKPHVDHWVEFAIERRVQRLELDLERLGQDTTDCYPFPLQILGNPNISFLKALSLNYVDVTKEVLESLLLKCHSLEFLSVSNSVSLVGQFVIGESLKLKHLEIVQCPGLKNLRISAVKLRSLTFVGPETTRVILENTPNLAANIIWWTLLSR